MTSSALIHRNRTQHFYLVEFENKLDPANAAVRDTNDTTSAGDDYKYKFADNFWIEAANKAREEKMKSKKVYEKNKRKRNNNKGQ